MKTLIIQLYKEKGERDEFGNQHNIHTKLDIPKFFDHTVMHHAKEIIIKNMTKFQIGTKTETSSTRTPLYNEECHLPLHEAQRARCPWWSSCTTYQSSLIGSPSEMV